jgi:hypothetical protein
VGENACDSCPVNTYNDEVGANSIKSCKSCPHDSPLAPAGSSSVLQCIATLCSDGYRTLQGYPDCSVQCPKGAFCTGGQVSSCPSGTFNPNRGASNATDCVPCPLGSFTASIGSPGCLPCPAGYFQDSKGNVQCIPCEENTYNPTAGSTSISACLPCGVSAPYSPIGSVSSLQCTSPPCDWSVNKTTRETHSHCDQ